MSEKLFASGKGNDLWYFLFGNADDLYPTDSLIYLNLKNTIILNLKEAGYRKICFVHRTGDYVQIEMRPRDKAEFGAAAYMPFINPNGYKRQLEINGSCVFEYVPEKFGKYLLSRLNEQTDTAIVFYGAAALDGIWGPEDLNSLARSRDSIVKTRGNCCVVVSSVLTSDSKPYLFGDRSIFRMNKEICPKLSSIIENEPADPYSQIRKELPDRTAFLFDLSREQIYLIMKEFLLFDMDQNSFPYSDQLLEESTEFIYYWYHSLEMRKQYYTLLPENPRGKIRVLRDFLWNSEFTYNSAIRCRNLLQAIDDLKKTTGKNIHDSLFEEYKDLMDMAMIADSEEENYVPEKLSELVEDMKHSAAFSGKFWDIQTQINESRPYLQKPLSEEMSSIFEFMIAHTRRAIREEDNKTYLRCIGLLHFCRKNMWIYRPDHKINYDAWQNIIELSEQIFGWQGNIKTRSSKIEEQIRVRDQAMRTVDELRLTRYEETDWEINYYKDKAVQASKEIKTLQNKNNFTSQQILAITSMLNELEDTAVNFQEGNAEYLQKKLESYRAIQKKFYAEIRPEEYEDLLI